MRIAMTAILLAALCAGTAFAGDDSLDKAAKKTSDGFGNLLNAMGQEIKKTGIGDEKKDEKKGEKKDEKNSAKADPNPKGDRQ